MSVRYYMNKFFLASASWIKFHFIRMRNFKKNHVSLKHYAHSVKYTLTVHKFPKLENFHSISE